MTTRRGDDPRPLPSETALRLIMRRLREIMGEESEGQDKLDRIGSLGCDVFMDDLPEFLGEASFPSRPRKVLFDPANACPDRADYTRVPSWSDFATLVLGMKEGRWAA